MKYRIASYLDQTVDSLREKIDCRVAIVSASWERRSQACMKLLEASQITRLIVIRFPNHGTTGMSGSIRTGYKAFCKKNGIEHVEIVFDSVSKDHLMLVKAAKSVDSALAGASRVLLDISSTPRLLWSSLVALWDRQNSIRRILFIYSRPRYQFTENPRREQIFDYTQGSWELCDPAFFANLHASGLFKSNILSIGYEYDYVKSVVYKLEAEENIFVYSKPGFQAKYDELAEATIRKIRNVFEIYDANIMAFAVNDLEGLCFALDERIALIRKNKESSVMLICAGSKIHSLAFTLAALRNNAVSIKIRVPAKYKEVSTEWTGTMDAFVIENVFCPL